MTCGFSRDDAEAKFIPLYVREGILTADPFEELDRAGVGELIAIAVQRGRATRPDLHIGICGEAGGLWSERTCVRCGMGLALPSLVLALSPPDPAAAPPRPAPTRRCRPPQGSTAATPSRSSLWRPWWTMCRARRCGCPSRASPPPRRPSRPPRRPAARWTTARTDPLRCPRTLALPPKLTCTVPRLVRPPPPCLPQRLSLCVDRSAVLCTEHTCNYCKAWPIGTKQIYTRRAGGERAQAASGQMGMNRRAHSGICAVQGVQGDQHTGQEI